MQHASPPSVNTWSKAKGLLAWLLVLLSLPGSACQAQDNAGEAAKPAEPVKLPGLVADVEHARVDVEATVCLKQGPLELVACTKDTKEHESIVTVEAEPKIIHAALLMIGAKSGSPARTEPVNEAQTQWRHIAPTGDRIAVSLVYQDAEGKAVERPIREFIRRSEGFAGDNAEQDKDKAQAGDDKGFDYFLFAGSLLTKDDKGGERYEADDSGNVISISTFGDEVLCLPREETKDNNALAWEIDPTHLPKVGTKVTLRLTRIKKDAEEMPAGQ